MLEDDINLVVKFLDFHLFVEVVWELREGCNWLPFVLIFALIGGITHMNVLILNL